MMVQARSMSGKVLWSHDFGYNASSPNQVSVESSPTLNAAIVHYSGYKWDHAHVLLLVTPGKGATEAPKVTAYDPSALLTELKRHRQFKKGTEYLIQPSGIEKDLVKFECIPLAGADAPHPFLQDHSQWFTIEGKLDKNHSILPVRVTPAEEAGSPVEPSPTK
jgi:hypothetical protein